MTQTVQAAQEIPQPPSGWGRLAWFGPGIIWMLSAAASGELLFTPRVASLYGYTLLWAILLALTLKFFINREIGRYTVCTGRRLLEGFADLPGPRNWAVWIVVVPQIAVAISTIAGLSSGAASALILELGGGLQLWTIVTTITAVALVIWGRYEGVEKVSSTIAIVLGLGAIAAAISVGPDVGSVVAGVAPVVPHDVAYAEILPWLGFMSAGAAGLMWYSYWVGARGFGLAGIDDASARPDLQGLDGDGRARLHGWLRQMSLDTTVAILGTFVITLSFLILGVELLRPEGIVPAEEDVAGDLTNLFSGVWGSFGYWFLLIGIYVGFWDTVLTDQDGFGRLLGNGTQLILRAFGVSGRWTDSRFLMIFYLVVVLAIIPIAVFLWIGEPVPLLQFAGITEAVHIPIVTALILYLNQRALPKGLRASTPVFWVTVAAGVFFLCFAGFFAAQELGWI